MFIRKRISTKFMGFGWPCFGGRVIFDRKLLGAFQARIPAARRAPGLQAGADARPIRGEKELAAFAIVDRPNCLAETAEAMIVALLEYQVAIIGLADDDRAHLEYLGEMPIAWAHDPLK